MIFSIHRYLAGKARWAKVADFSRTPHMSDRIGVAALIVRASHVRQSTSITLVSKHKVVTPCIHQLS